MDCQCNIQMCVQFFVKILQNRVVMGLAIRRVGTIMPTILLYGPSARLLFYNVVLTHRKPPRWPN